jgi:hypothetical protein
MHRVTKKVLIGLAPLLAIAALMAMPAVSGAVPHVYKNGTIGKEGSKVREISWGTVKLTNGTLGEVICHTIFAGFAENPKGGGAAGGKVQAFFPYECESASCLTLGGKGIQVTAGKLPWKAEATEPEVGVFRQKTGEKGNTTESVHFTVNCEGVVEAEFFGQNSPKVLNNGKAIGALPGELEFDAGAGELESVAIGGGATHGTVKVQGYGEQELIEVKNP